MINKEKAINRLLLQINYQELVFNLDTVLFKYTDHHDRTGFMT